MSHYHDSDDLKILGDAGGSGRDLADRRCLARRRRGDARSARGQALRQGVGIVGRAAGPGWTLAALSL